MLRSLSGTQPPREGEGGEEEEEGEGGMEVQQEGGGGFKKDKSGCETDYKHANVKTLPVSC